MPSVSYIFIDVVASLPTTNITPYLPLWDDDTLVLPQDTGHDSLTLHPCNQPLTPYAADQQAILAAGQKSRGG